MVEPYHKNSFGACPRLGPSKMCWLWYSWIEKAVNSTPRQSMLEAFGPRNGDSMTCNFSKSSDLDARWKQQQQQKERNKDCWTHQCAPVVLCLHSPFRVLALAAGRPLQPVGKPSVLAPVKREGHAAYAGVT
eukprot:1160773-Pelagomonas_calceolata.AAC.8